MSMTVDGVWKAGVWATTVWADGVWREGTPTPTPTPTPTAVAGGGGGGYYGKPSYTKKRFDKRLEELIDADVREAYAQMHGPAAEEAADVVRPFAKSEAAIPTVAAVDWKAVRRDVDAVKQLLAIYRRHLDLLDDDDEVAML
jgi:hypothetical protein